MFTLNHLLGIFNNKNYRWENFAFASGMQRGYGNTARRSGRLRGRTKSIYHKWGFNNDAYHVNLTKAERAGKTWQETQTMRYKIWKKRKHA